MKYHPVPTSNLFPLLIGLLLMGLLPTNTKAQNCPFTEDDAVADTLEPQGYYPLEVGNIWEYTEMSGANMGDPRREEVVKDTLIDGELFYKLKTTIYQYDPDLITEASIQYRYLTTTDTSIVQWLQGQLEENPIRFIQDFNSCYFVNDQVLYAAEGGYDRSFEIEESGVPVSYQVAAMKSIGSSFSLIEDYAYGIGRVGSRGDPSVVTNLVYAQIDGQEYGIELADRFAIALSSDPSYIPGDELVVSSFPNPFSNSVRIRVELATVEILAVEVINVLGQVVERPLSKTQLGSGSHTFEWDSQGLPSGMYFVKLVLGDQRYVVEPLIKTK